MPEMSDARHVVLAFSLGSKAEDAAALLSALQEIDADMPCPVPQASGATAGPAPAAALADSQAERSESPHSNNSTWNNFTTSLISARVPFSLRPVLESETESIRLEYSIGRVAAEMVIPYPPGIPLLYPGEAITEAICNRLSGLSKGGAKFQACADPVLQHIKVYNIQKGGEV